MRRLVKNVLSTICELQATSVHRVLAHMGEVDEVPAIRVSWDELHLSTLSGLLTRNTNFGRCFTKTLSAMTLSRTARSWLRWHPTRNDLSYHFLRPEDSENSDDPRVWTLQCQTARIGRPFITLHSKRAQSSSKVANPPDAGASSANAPRVLAQRFRQYGSVQTICTRLS